jgi:hypothetical protein
MHLRFFFVIHWLFKRAIVQEYNENVIFSNDISFRSHKGMDIEFRKFLGWAMFLGCSKSHELAAASTV